MKTLIAASALILAAGCAHEPTQVAQRECKVVPITTASIAGAPPKNLDSLDQRRATGQLATSQYRFANLNRNGMAFNNIEDALRDCN
jgi:hypothetical protein